MASYIVSVTVRAVDQVLLWLEYIIRGVKRKKLLTTVTEGIFGIAQPLVSYILMRVEWVSSNQCFSWDVMPVCNSLHQWSCGRTFSEINVEAVTTYCRKGLWFPICRFRYHVPQHEIYGKWILKTIIRSCMLSVLHLCYYSVSNYHYKVPCAPSPRH